MNKEKLACIRLFRSENIGTKTFQSLIELYGLPSRALDEIPRMAANGGRKKPLKLISESEAVKEIENCKRKGADIITIFDEVYPRRLKQISDFPPVLTIYGKPEVLNREIVAIVGARNSSANGCRFAGQIATELGRHNIITASGLARGIDTAVHKGSLQAGTIAVVAGGIDKIYPPENKDLFKQIAENGVVVAEMPFGAVPKAQNFPRRNRIISGVSLGTLVVEASLNSGSLITARMSLEQNREVFAVPGSPLDPRCKGTNKLIKDGARLVDCVEDILNEISYLNDKWNSSMEDGDATYSQAQGFTPAEDEIDRARPEIIQKLGSSPTEVDEIISQTGIPAKIVLTVLLELELAGRLDRHPGNKVSIVYTNDELFEEAI